MKKFLLSIVCLIAAVNFPSAHAASLDPGAPIELSGTHGKFDFIKVDAAQRRLLACHTGNGSLDVIDLDHAKLLKSIATGAAQGVAIDEKGGRYFVSSSKPPKLVIVDATKLEVIGEVPLPGPADLVAYHPGLNRAFVCNDEKPEMWVIDPEAKKIVSTLTLPGGGMEDIGFNADGSFLYQNLKDSSMLAKIDPKTLKIVATWPTAPAEKPHGFAMVEGADAVLIAGGTGKLTWQNLSTGKVVGSTDIAPRVDEIAYDPKFATAYCASGTGVISVVHVGRGDPGTIATVSSSPGAHSIAVDRKTHTVWIAYAKGEKAFVQPFTASLP